MRNSVLVAALAIIFALSPFMVAPGHADDIGDGNPEACWLGEICFYRDSANEQYQRQFWWDADHGGQNWRNTYAHNWWGFVQDDALMFNNRDTQCRVRVGNLNPNGYWNWYYFDRGLGKTYLGGVANMNDRHERCPPP